MGQAYQIHESSKPSKVHGLTREEILYLRKKRREDASEKKALRVKQKVKHRQEREEQDIDISEYEKNVKSFKEWQEGARNYGMGYFAYMQMQAAGEANAGPQDTCSESETKNKRKDSKKCRKRGKKSISNTAATAPQVSTKMDIGRGQNGKLVPIFQTEVLESDRDDKQGNRAERATGPKGTAKSKVVPLWHLVEEMVCQTTRENKHGTRELSVIITRCKPGEDCCKENYTFPRKPTGGRALSQVEHRSFQFSKRGKDKSNQHEKEQELLQNPASHTAKHRKLKHIQNQPLVHMEKEKKLTLNHRKQSQSVTPNQVQTLGGHTVQHGLVVKVKTSSFRRGYLLKKFGSQYLESQDSPRRFWIDVSRDLVQDEMLLFEQLKLVLVVECLDGDSADIEVGTDVSHSQQQRSVPNQPIV